MYSYSTIHFKQGNCERNKSCWWDVRRCETCSIHGTCNGNLGIRIDIIMQCERNEISPKCFTTIEAIALNCQQFLFPAHLTTNLKRVYMRELANNFFRCCKASIAQHITAWNLFHSRISTHTQRERMAEQSNRCRIYFTSQWNSRNIMTSLSLSFFAPLCCSRELYKTWQEILPFIRLRSHLLPLHVCALEDAICTCAHARSTHRRRRGI